MDIPFPGYTAEYLAEDIGPSVIATSIIMMIICTVFVGLRYYARHITSTKFGAEDVIIPFAWLAEIGQGIVAISRTALHLPPENHIA